MKHRVLKKNNYLWLIIHTKGNRQLTIVGKKEAFRDIFRDIARVNVPMKRSAEQKKTSDT